jgi:glycosidase
VLAHWQELGVAGFRVDMAHMVPLEYWRWQLRRARARQPQVFFCAEQNDAAFKAALAQGNGGLEPGLAGSDD